jgi:protein tyrosine phosphatase (PTP) superfamily phosphohydrolase (DUF442 family)
MTIRCIIFLASIVFAIGHVVPLDARKHKISHKRKGQLYKSAEKTYKAIKNLGGNFHEVESGKFYRSAQLSPSKLEHYIKKHHIKTVINLRGAHPKESWWQKEKNVIEKNGARYHNISMQASCLTSKKNLQELLQLYDQAIGPILVHCHGGSDRAGEASALWVLEKKHFSFDPKFYPAHTPEQQASRQTIKQKHAKKAALEQLDKKFWHDKKRYPAKRFLIEIWGGREWLETTYNPALYPKFPQQT